MLRVLWVVNIPLPEASMLLKEKPSNFGGWLINTSNHLSNIDDCMLSIAFPHNKMETSKVLQGENIKYYVFPNVNRKKVSLADNTIHLKNILNEAKPDLVHIYGTEFEHTLAMTNLCNEKGIKSIISIQGLVSVIAKHYVSNLPLNVQWRFTFRDFIKQDNIIKQQKQFIKRGIAEIEAIKNTKHVIGRTTWDKACTLEINPNIQYHFCNETLREEFYKHKWSMNTCEKYSIFVSQGAYPIKGLHYILEAMYLILKKYPESRLYIAGNNIVKSDTLKDKLKKSSYAHYIERVIRRYNLEAHIIFTGPLGEKQMCQRYLKSHVFVCPSTIENSPNSLGEAMILGVPSVAAYVGGIPDMLEDKEEGFLYQHDAPYMLAHYACKIFKNENIALKFSENARKHAMKTHDRNENTKRLIEIYNDVLEKKVE